MESAVNLPDLRSDPEPCKQLAVYCHPCFSLRVFMKGLCSESSHCGWYAMVLAHAQHWNSAPGAQQQSL